MPMRQGRSDSALESCMVLAEERQNLHRASIRSTCPERVHEMHILSDHEEDQADETAP